MCFRPLAAPRHGTGGISNCPCKIRRLWGSKAVDTLPDMSRTVWFLAAAVLLTGCVTETPAEPTYEFVVVGSGAGGGPLAARLARLGHKVLLLEAGEDVGGKLKYQVPAYHALSTEDEDLAWWFFVQHHQDRAIDETDSKYTPDGILYPRGSALGGSTAVNAMVTVVPPASDWNRLSERTGDGGFRAVKMRAYQDRVAEWLSTENADPTLAMNDRSVFDFFSAAASVLADESDDLGPGTDLPGVDGTAKNLATLSTADLNEAVSAGETEGLFRLPVATKDGRRNGTREFILDTVAAGYDLTVKTGHFVTQVVFDEEQDPPRAIGVIAQAGKGLYKAGLGTPGEASDPVLFRAEKDVILSAGVFNSPQLLMLSGVGERAHLEEMGIDVVAHVPAVGSNLQDRTEVSVVTEMERDSDILKNCRLGRVDMDDPCLLDWMADRPGAYNTNGFLASALVRSDPNRPDADLQIFATPSDARGYYPGYSEDAVREKKFFSWLILKAHSKNNDGVIRLRDKDPFNWPTIQFNAFDEEDPLHDEDLRAVVEGVKLVRRFADRARSQNEGDPLIEVTPGPEVVTDDDIAAWARKEAWGHHACCTNPMGKDDDDRAVVDSHFRVKRTAGLRVMDASVFPEIPGTFIAMPIFMLSERAADVIHEEYRD